MHSLVETEPRTIDELVRVRANIDPDAVVVSYPSSGTDYVDYTLSQLDEFGHRVAKQYGSDLPPRRSSSEKTTVVAILGVSNLDYVVTMLALTKLGHTVQMMSPRLSQAAYEHLVAATGAKHLIFQSQFRDKAEKLKQTFQGLGVTEAATLSSYADIKYRSVDTKMTPGLEFDRELSQVAWIFHSSGSTSLPKPIHITHKAALKNYHRNRDYLGFRSFLTLPVYHTHGISSLFRAFITGQVIRIYNAALLLTQPHMISSMRAHEAEIFCTVPYALQILHESQEGIEFLRRFKLVTFGGAPCPDTLGDALTALGVKLVTIYGMGEAGPIMTSWRPAGDDAWTYLRPSPEAEKNLIFEDRGDGLYELIVGANWPSRVASNRPDGSYATKDLFHKHPTLNAWKYSGRIDDVIVLEKGEKANPLPVEGAVRQNELVAEAVVFGVGKPHFGIMVVLTSLADGIPKDKVIDQILPSIEESQRLLPRYARISRDMVVVLPSDIVYPRTDKGTVIRKAFYAQFAQEIDDAYIGEEIVPETLEVFSQDELRDFLRSEIKKIAGLEDVAADLADDQDFFELGIDSLQASRLRAVIARKVDVNGEKLDLNIVFDYPSLSALASRLDSLRTGASAVEHDTAGQVKRLIEKYGDFSDTARVRKADQEQVVLLTGATGSLGAHLLAQLIQTSAVTTVYCLVRATSAANARQRVVESLNERKLYHTLSLTNRRKIVALPSSLGLALLGLETSTYMQIAQEVTTVYHIAWTVNFNLRLGSFEKDCIAGLRNIIDLCLEAGDNGRPVPRLAFASSVGTVLRTTSSTVPESLPDDFSTAQPTGYAQSKLVAEYMCAKAIAQAGVPVYVMRIGQIAGDTRHGVWNGSEAVPLMLQTSKTIGALPTIDESLRWLPVDAAARSMREITSAKDATPGFFNLVNPQTFHWTRDLLPYLRAAGLVFDELDPPAWLRKIRSSNQDPAKNPPAKLLEYLNSNYDSTEPRRAFVFETDNAKRYSETLRSIKAPGETLVTRIIRHFLDTSWRPIAPASSDSSQGLTIIVSDSDPNSAGDFATKLATRLQILPTTRDTAHDLINGQTHSKASSQTEGQAEMQPCRKSSIITLRPTTAADRERLRERPGARTLFLALQREDDAEVVSAVYEDETDFLPLDGGLDRDEMLEETVGLIGNHVN